MLADGIDIRDVTSSHFSVFYTQGDVCHPNAAEGISVPVKRKAAVHYVCEPSMQVLRNAAVRFSRLLLVFARCFPGGKWESMRPFGLVRIQSHRTTTISLSGFRST